MPAARGNYSLHPFFWLCGQKVSFLATFPCRPSHDGRLLKNGNSSCMPGLWAVVDLETSRVSVTPIDSDKTQELRISFFKRKLQLIFSNLSLRAGLKPHVLKVLHSVIIRSHNSIDTDESCVSAETRTSIHLTLHQCCGFVFVTGQNSFEVLYRGREEQEAFASKLDTSPGRAPLNPPFQGVFG